MGSISTLVTSTVCAREIKWRILDPLLKGNEAPEASVQILHITEGEEPEANDPRVRLCRQHCWRDVADCIFLVDGGSSESTPRALGETLLHGSRNAGR